MMTNSNKTKISKPPVWKIEEVGRQIKVYRRTTSYSKHGNQWYNSYHWELMHPSHIYATCRSTIRQMGYEGWPIWDATRETVREETAKGLSPKEISLKTIVLSEKQVKKILSTL